MDPLPENLSVVVAHREDDTRQKLTAIVRGFGYQVSDGCTTVNDLMTVSRQVRPNLIISGIGLEDGNAIDALIRISEDDPTPAIIVTPRDSLLDVEKALRDHVMAYLVEPIDEEQIRPTIYLVCERFRQFEMLKEQNKDLKQALADRKVIEKAKGLLMGRDEIPEDEAFRQLQKMAQSARIKLAELAQQVIDQDSNTAESSC